MYAIANCVVTVTRGTTVDPVSGNKIPASTVVYTGSANIQEEQHNSWDLATQTPRTVRDLTMRVPSTADVAQHDYVLDTTHNVRFTVMGIQQNYGPLFVPDKVCDLKRVN